MQEDEIKKEIREHLKNQIRDAQKLMTSSSLSEQHQAIYGIIFWNAMILKKLNY